MLSKITDIQNSHIRQTTKKERVLTRKRFKVIVVPGQIMGENSKLKKKMVASIGLTNR